MYLGLSTMTLATMGVGSFAVALGYAAQRRDPLWVLALGIPLTLRLREQQTEEATGNNSQNRSWITALVRHPEQPMFFVPVVLMAILLVIKIDFGWNVLALALEGVVVVLGAFFAKERSYRLTGLGLLFLCVLKYFLWDMWKLSGSHALSLIGLGALILVASYLFSRNRKALRDYL